jgi:hypothetical protein
VTYNGLLPVVVIALTSLACSNNGTTPATSPTAAPLAGAPIDGNWSGLTSQSKQLTFVVGRNEVTQFTSSIGGTFTCPGITGGFEMGGTFGTATIRENAFSFSNESPGSSDAPTPAMTLTVEGSFTSDDTASGTLAATNARTPAPSCPPIQVSVTWTAHKQSPIR